MSYFAAFLWQLLNSCNNFVKECQQTMLWRLLRRFFFTARLRQEGREGRATRRPLRAHNRCTNSLSLFVGVTKKDKAIHVLVASRFHNDKSLTLRVRGTGTDQAGTLLNII